MYKVKFSLVRTVELQSWQEFELTDEQAKELKELEIIMTNTNIYLI